MDQTCEKITIGSAGARLLGTLYKAEGTARASLVLHGATGVPQRFYRHFATWAAGQGITTLTYDYRDFGESLEGHPKHSKAVFADWLVHDQAAAQAKLAEIAPEGPLWVLGHSLGGLGIPFHRYDPRVSRIITSGAGRAHFTDHPWSYRPKALAFWFGIGPLATTLAGFMPGRRLRFGADLPAGVYWQWRRWCTQRDFYDADLGKTLPAPEQAETKSKIRICVATDDQVVPPVAVKRYADSLAAIDATFVTFDPQEYSREKFGHIDILSPSNTAVWPDLLALQEWE
ncbi:alpha/beta fold hydrolase [Arenibacterium sp. LLYu02]|uniref:alpha/beta hydrolase family protein n=1 Tax=Arenibacterium sp. LLYu02 TaxID=3404132 RepID=UPI003B218677